VDASPADDDLENGHVVTARSYAEYEAMLDLGHLPARILDCCACGSSFTAEASREGSEAIAVHPA
jgi:hypothetical protein